MTSEQRQVLREFDSHQERLERQLRELLERRREYINTNQLNKKVCNVPNIEEEKYHDKYKCIECGGDNDVTNESYDQSHISECSTQCKKCGYKTSWGYGFFDQSP